MAPPSVSSRLSSASGALTWRPTKIMHMRDLSKDDDFLSHLLVEKLGTGTVPLLVHKMDSSRRLPKTDTQDLMRIVRRLVVSKGPIAQAIRQAVDELLELPPIRYYLKSYTQKQINAFATHASRYFELYNPAGSIEIAHTSRYSHHTGKSELCILATRNLAVGTVVTELKGSMANLTDEEDKELKRTDLRNCDIRRDFSVIHSKSMKKNHLFLGPARFVNHDCDNNCELFREGRYITFRVLRPIAIGEEITAHYGDGYFGKKNRHCLCETCEKNGRGGYSPEHQNEEPDASSDSSSGSDSDSDSDSETSSSDAESDIPEPLNVNERSTRRGVYAITKPKADSSDDSDNEEEEDKAPAMGALGDSADGDIELIADREVDAGSELTSLATSMPPSDGFSPAKCSTPGLMTPDRNVAASRSSSSLTELTSTTGRSTPKSNQSTPFRSIISTRRQRAAERESQELAAASTGKRKASQSEGASPSRSVEPSPKRLTRSISSLMLSEKKGNGKGKSKATPTPVSTPRSGKASVNGKQKDDVKVKKEDTADPRVLRTRPSLATPDVPKDSPKPDVLRGPDGKPLPICSTCANVLPLIAVDSKVVWGLGAEASSKKKKNVKHDCPRCLRHFAIYQRPWPSRIVPRGTISETPREETPVEVITKKVTHNGLSVLDRKLAAAASASASSTARTKKSKKRVRAVEVEEEQNEIEHPPAKRRKSEPEHVLHKAKVTKTYQSRPKKYKRVPTPEPVEEEDPEPLSARRKRGRPRLPSPRPAVDPNVKLEDTAPDADRLLLSQPRSINGRFGRKEKARKAAELAAMAQKALEEGRELGTEDGIGMVTRGKRSNAVLEQLEHTPRKRAAIHVSSNHEAEVVQRVLPHPISGFRGGRLNSKMNPQAFAQHAWGGQLVLSDDSSSSSSSSSDDDKHPETPDDADSLAAGIATPSEEGSAYAAPVSIMPPGPLTFKPSPFAFAKSRWNGRSLSHGQLSLVRKLSITESKRLYLTDDEDPATSHSECDINTRVDDYSSPLSSDSASPHKLRLVYPVLHPKAAANSFMPKTTTFASQNSETIPSFIHAGWDDTSDASEA